MKSIYEQVGGTYTRQGDYEFPDLKVPPEKEIEIGVWGQRYRRHLKQHHRIRYYNLLTSGTLNRHLAEVAQQAERLFQSLVSVLSKQENVTEKLNADRPMEWVQKTNSIRNIIFIFRKLSADFLSKISFGFRANCGRKGAIPTL